MSQLPSANDDTALYRTSGWALKSAIENVAKLIKNDKGAQGQLDLLSLKRHQDEKVFLPPGARYLDGGGGGGVWGIDIYALIPTTLATCCQGKHTHLSQPRGIQEIRREYLQCKFVVEISRPAYSMSLILFTDN